jgi:hypothetical protein
MTTPTKSEVKATFGTLKAAADLIGASHRAVRKWIASEHMPKTARIALRAQGERLELGLEPWD